jgi:acetylornithine deacetylase/succinyl-diaminopimelate desuccinylase-like protein
MNPYEFAETHQADFLEELKEWVRIPSISTTAEHKADIRRAAEWAKAQLTTIGMTRTEIFETAGHPVVYGEWLGARAARTVLIYGHYGVQPTDDPEHQWRTDPFEPVVHDGKLYGRGATDDKGQTFTQMKAIQSLLASGEMPVNVKFIIEGEEENGSDHLYPFVEEHTDLLKADVIVISDTHMMGLDRPSIVVGLRGMVSMEMEVRGPSQDLHSGLYGGVVHNPAQALVEILAELHDENGHITVPGFYDRVRELSDEERAELARVPFSAEQLKEETGVARAWGEPDYTFRERIGTRPTLEINGLVGGWTGEGGKTVIPARAVAKVSCRLVPAQKPLEIYEQIRDYVAEITPASVTSEVRLLHKGMWALVDSESPYMWAAVGAYEFGFGTRPVFVREGGSIPIVGFFQEKLGVPVILMGFGLPDDNLHGPNEKFTLECFYRGMKTAIRFYQEIGATNR